MVKNKKLKSKRKQALAAKASKRGFKDLFEKADDRTKVAFAAASDILIAEKSGEIKIRMVMNDFAKLFRLALSSPEFFNPYRFHKYWSELLSSEDKILFLKILGKGGKFSMLHLLPDDLFLQVLRDLSLEFDVARFLRQYDKDGNRPLANKNGGTIA